MPGIGDLVAHLTVDNGKWTSGLKAAGGQMKTFTKGLTSMIGPVAATLGAAWGAKSSLDAARTQLMAEKKLANAFSSTTAVAGQSQDSIKKYAGELQSLTGIGDEVTLGSAAVLAGFKKINGVNFTRTLTAAADLSAQVGGDMTSQVKNLGSILANPAEGYARLADAGINFTKEQQTQIKVMQAAGDMAGAQGVILGEVEKRYGGAAAALASPWTQAMTGIKSVGEMFGSLILPAFDTVAKSFTSGTSLLTGYKDSFRNFGVEVGVWAGVAIDTFKAAGQGIRDNLEPGITWVKESVYSLFDYVAGDSSFEDWGISAAVWVSHTGDVLAWLGATATASIVGFGNDAAYVFTDQLPAYIGWFADNFTDIIFTAVDYTATIFINLGTNIRNMWSAVLDFIRGNGFEFDWTPLTEGAKSAIDSLPEIPARAKTEFEKALAADAAALGKNLDASMDAQRQKLKENLGKARADAMAAYDPKSDKEGAGDNKAPVAMSGSKAYGGALAAGSTEAYSAIVQAGAKMKNPQIETTNALLKEISKKTKPAGGMPPVKEAFQ